MAKHPALHPKKRRQNNEDEWQGLTHWFCSQNKQIKFKKEITDRWIAQHRWAAFCEKSVLWGKNETGIKTYPENEDSFPNFFGNYFFLPQQSFPEKGVTQTRCKKALFQLFGLY